VLESEQSMQQDSGDRETVFRILLLGVATACAILASVFSLTHGISEVFSFLYILPIILCVYFFPRRAVLFTLAISLLYIGQVYLFGVANTGLVAVATAWFAIFMTIGVVASSYANRMLDEQIRIKNILENSQDGIISFDRKNGHIIEVNPTCARWLRYDAAELVGSDLSRIWTDPTERDRFLRQVATSGQESGETEGLFRAKDGTVLRFVISVLMVSRDRVYCSAIDITGSKIVDEEIRRTLEDLEEQVKARTAHLQRINEELRAEILERRRFEETLLAGQAHGHDEREGRS
jgi:PAS domain S-box-containing protein